MNSHQYYGNWDCWNFALALEPFYCQFINANDLLFVQINDPHSTDTFLPPPTTVSLVDVDDSMHHKDPRHFSAIYKDC